MHYTKFVIENYRAIKGPLTLDLRTRTLLPLIGLNECGKTTILQALYAFDYANDKYYGSGHVNDVKNLYATKSGVASVTASIQISNKELNKLLASFVLDKTQELNTEVSRVEDDLTQPDDEVSPQPELALLAQWAAGIKKHTWTVPGIIEIQRNLNEKLYSLIGPNSESGSLGNSFCELLLSEAPYILYNDDFQDRPPSEIVVSDDNDEVNAWEEIYDRLFRDTDSDYSLRKASLEKDERRRNSIVSDVQTKLNSTLSEAWKSFNLDKNRKVEIQLAMTVSGDAKAALKIHIVENLGKKERFFTVNDRSKGFLWFYNFVMKTQFNPKLAGSGASTVYLLDEPGSYLHAAAQTKLCAKLREISVKNGPVIYCTHSAHLLEPGEIPLNDVHVVTKTSSKKIEVCPLPLFKTTAEKTTALQPIYEALQMNATQFTPNSSKPMLLVEGIYDKYAIGLFMATSDDFDILPGTSADSIKKNIQFVNAFGRPYVALWDSDKEGTKELGRARKAFGEHEAKRFIALPLDGISKRRMEEMFELEDLKSLGTLVGLGPDSSYEGIIGSLYHAASDVRAKAIASLASSSTARFVKLKNMIASALVDAN